MFFSEFPLFSYSTFLCICIAILVISERLTKKVGAKSTSGGGKEERIQGNRPLGFSSSRISPIPGLPPTVIKSSFPVYNPTYIDEQADANFELAFAVVRRGRPLMTNYNITKRVQIYILGSIEITKLLRSDEAVIAT
ncbi:hypothetical protein BKA57DRAFT_449515 [Linnemannia elongata]|nr:hypothetical protein BKA57DRAFT_449515 [Linnemannia elongata]